MMKLGLFEISLGEAGRAFDLHVVNLGLISTIPYGPPSTASSDFQEKHLSIARYALFSQKKEEA